MADDYTPLTGQDADLWMYRMAARLQTNDPASRALKAAFGGGALLPANTQVAAVGDSIAYAAGFASKATNIKMYMKSYINWGAFLGRQRWTFDNENNFGIAGNNSDDVVARIDSVLRATTAGTMILHIGTNDQPNNVSLSQSKYNVKLIIKKIIDSGKICILMTPFPRDITASGLTMTATQYRNHLALRDFMFTLHNPGNGIYVVDSYRYLADPASTNGAMKAGFALDGLHPGVPAGYWAGKALAELCGTGRGPGLFPFRDVMVGQNTDVWNAGYTRGCVNSNPMMQGGASAATGYTIAGGSGMTATGSKVTSGTRTDIQQVVLGGTASANNDIYDLLQLITPGNLTIGDKVHALADVEYDSLSGVCAHGLTLVDTADFTNIAGFFSDATDANGVTFTLPEACSGVMRTPYLTLQSTSLRVGMKTRLLNTASPAGTYRVLAIATRKAA